MGVFHWYAGKIFIMQKLPLRVQVNWRFCNVSLHNYNFGVKQLFGV